MANIVVNDLESIARHTAKASQWENRKARDRSRLDRTLQVLPILFSLMIAINIISAFAYPRALIRNGLHWVVWLIQQENGRLVSMIILLLGESLPLV